VHLVRDPGGAGSAAVGLRGLARFAAVAVISAAGFLGCGGEGGEEPSGAGPNLAAPINLADCTDWKEASSDQRLGTIHQLRDFIGGPVSGTAGRGGVLDDDDAYDLFENYCQNDFARGFKLYKIYSRAAGFAGH
jgi:hypothetical protein